MFGNLMHSILGSTITSSQNATNNAIQSAYATQAGNILRPERISRNEKLFSGNVEVLRVSNGYIVNIGRREGYEYETHIAETVQEVNDIIAAQIVAFRLEDR